MIEINGKQNTERAMENSRLHDPINCERLSEVLYLRFKPSNANVHLNFYLVANAFFLTQSSRRMF